MYTEIELKKEKFCMTCVVTEELVNELKLCIGKTNDDFIRETFTLKLEASLISASEETETLTLYREPQSFWDFVFRRSQKFQFEINRKEIMKNAPILQNGHGRMIYKTSEV